MDLFSMKMKQFIKIPFTVFPQNDLLSIEFQSEINLKFGAD